MSEDTVELVKNLDDKINQKKNDAYKLEQQKKLMILDESFFKIGFWYSHKTDRYSIIRINHDEYVQCPNNLFGTYCDDDYSFHNINPDGSITTDIFVSDFQINDVPIIKFYKELVDHLVEPLKTRQSILEGERESIECKINTNKKRLSSIIEMIGTDN